MNRSRLLMIGGLALAVGLLVSFTVYNRLRTFAGSAGNEAGVHVVVAANDIQVGSKLEARDVRYNISIWHGEITSLAPVRSPGITN